MSDKWCEPYSKIPNRIYESIVMARIILKSNKKAMKSGA